jgi:predicted ATPase/DNA-binding SARP family transcriptional activator
VAHLQLSTLGPLQVSVDGRPIVFAYDKAPALLVYLAVESGQAHPRDSLAELLWPDRPSATARHNLSQALTTLRQTLQQRDARPSLLVLTRERIQFNPAAEAWLDVADFSAALDAVDRHAHVPADSCPSCAAELERAAGLYRGDFLAGFSAGDGAGYEQWLLVKREALRERAGQALARLADYRAAAGELDAAVHLARRQLDLDPWREPAYRQVMRFLALAGQRSAALAEYERCQHLLAAELGVEPEAETRSLYERIRSGELARLPAEPAPAWPPHNLPAQTTAFVGRAPELQELAERCADPTCRLLTLVGPGGVGKTRLALEAARQQAPNFRHGVRLVALAPLSSPDLLPAALAEALGFTPYGAEALPAQLLRHLREQHLLLVLDNFEHLLAGAPFLAEILAAAPHVKLLVTSREQLSLRGEWVFPVEGLNAPAGDTAGDLAGSSAVQLFVQSARRARPAFALDSDNQAAVASICRLVGGLPLGLELAAAWLPVLSAVEIVQEIEHSLDFLVAELRDLPERHHNLRAVFDHSWRLLTDPERAAFRRLSVLRGGFTRAAAEAVAGASLVDLARLTAKSLLRRTGGGRYELHELLRQYGEARLRERPEEEQPTRERHGVYYLTFLAAREAALKSYAQPAALAEIATEMENIRAAWEWAVQAGKADLVATAIDAFWLFSEVRGRYGEAERYFRLAVETLEAAPEHVSSRALALGKALACLGSWHMRMGQPEVLQTLGARSLALLRPLDARREIAFALNILAAGAHAQGAYADERRLLQESIGLGQAAGDRWITGYSLNDLGLVAFLKGEAGEARRLCAQSLALFQAIGDSRGQAFALHNLGLILSQWGELAEADQLLRQSLALWRLQNHRWGIATTLIRLGAVARARGDTPSARACWREAIQVGLEVGTWPPVLDALVEMAALLYEEGAGAQAVALAQAALEHPAGSAATRRNAERLLVDLGPVPGAPAADVEAFVADLLADGF